MLFDRHVDPEVFQLCTLVVIGLPQWLGMGGLCIVFVHGIAVYHNAQLCWEREERGGLYLPVEYVCAKGWIIV